MARFCHACGRSLDDHDRAPAFKTYVEEWDLDFPFGPLTPICDVRLVSGKPGNLFSPDPSVLPRPWQRVGKNGARYVHASRLQPGGDLA